jgi:Domain of unknown function (DUF4145)
MLSHHAAKDCDLPEGQALDFLKKACALFSGIATNLMKCPCCSHELAELWQPFVVITDEKGQSLSEPHSVVDLRLGKIAARVLVKLQWMQCHNLSCGRVLVRAEELLYDPMERSRLERIPERWFAVPRKPMSRPIDPFVKDPFRRNYIEASLILEDSPRMSAVLSRGILADLLEKFAGRSEYKLEDRIDKFIADPAHSASTVKDNLHHLRDIGNFGAHTKTNKLTGDIVEVGPEEAEWTLEVVESLFDYFIVGPEKNRQRRAEWDQKRGPQNPPAKKKNP